MSFFEILIAMVSIVLFIFSLVILYFRNNTTMLRAMFIPEIFLEDIADENSFRMSKPQNQAIGVSESGETRHEATIKKNFSVRFAIMLLATSLALMYFAIS